MEQKIIFREMLSEVMALADSKQNKLTKEEINDFFSNTHLTDEQMALVYEYLVSQKVQVVGYEKEGPNRFSETEDELTGQVLKKAADENPAEASEDAPCSMELYLDEIKQIGTLEPHEELQLFHQAAQKDAAAKNRLVELYLPLVCQLAGDYEGDVCPVEDLIQEGNIGLLMAVDHLEHQDSLAAYQAKLMNEVNQYMQDSCRNRRIFGRWETELRRK